MFKNSDLNIIEHGQSFQSSAFFYNIEIEMWINVWQIPPTL